MDVVLTLDGVIGARAAIAAGADALELDLRFTIDGVLVVAHPPDTGTCTDGGRCVFGSFQTQRSIQ